jgi:hypothetical protein
MRKNPQLEFEGAGFQKPKDCFGGALLKNSNAKVARPLDSKFAIHLTLRSSIGGMRRPKIFGRVNELVERTNHKYCVIMYRFANVGNHLHLLIKISRRRLWAPYIRELAGRIAQEVQGLKGLAKGAGFWEYRPFTRIVRGWRKAFQTAKDYVELNRLEAEGFISRQETKTLKDLRAIWADDW